MNEDHTEATMESNPWSEARLKLEDTLGDAITAALEAGLSDEEVGALVVHYIGGIKPEQNESGLVKWAWKVTRWFSPPTALFQVTKVKDGKVTALRCSEHSGNILGGKRKEKAEFDLALASYLQPGDLTVLQYRRLTYWLRAVFPIHEKGRPDQSISY
jgi:hypothetical protein